MSANNQGIHHLKVGEMRTACKNPSAHMYLPYSEFVAYEGKRCKRCEKYAAKQTALAAKRAAAKTPPAL